MQQEIRNMLDNLGLADDNHGTYIGDKELPSSRYITSRSPVDGKIIGRVSETSRELYETVVKSASEAFLQWRLIPAPRRGEVVRQFGEELRAQKRELGMLVSWEMGKSLQEGLGEVQEMIDICDYAVGLSRQLYGLTMHSERPLHRMYEQYHPLGLVGVISAFNFPIAVWAWNAAIAWVCGDVVVWKPSEKVPLCGVACQTIIARVLKKNKLPAGISCLINGDFRIGKLMAADENISLVSATGSTHMGKSVGRTVAERLGRSLLELGGNNAIIITESADLDLALTGAVFGAIGTAGQRCTTTRRLIVHRSKYAEVSRRLKSAYSKIIIGNPLAEGVHMGPLIDRDAVNSYLAAIREARKQGGKALVEGGQLKGRNYDSGCYVKPAVYEISNKCDIVQKETFAPILYLMKYETFDKAIEMHNSVRQGLSSSLMSLNMREMELFLSHSGSDCGIANVNIGTSGAEIGGAFGGEKDTGGGRESGSDSWKYYMRRQTNTINYSSEIPLAQGIKFKL